MPRDLAILACTECKRRNYTTTRNKKTQTERVELMKFCPFERSAPSSASARFTARPSNAKRPFAHRVLVQWQSSSLQNCLWGFESLTPCHKDGRLSP